MVASGVVGTALAACGSSSGGPSAASNVVAGSCGSLGLSGAPVVSLTTATGSAPAMTGGTVVPGDYVLTSATAYGGSTPWTPEQAVMRISASAVTFDLQAMGAAEIIDGQSYTTSGNAFQYAFTCGVSGDVKTIPETYTATATTIALSSNESGGSTYTVELFTMR